MSVESDFSTDGQRAESFAPTGLVYHPVNPFAVRLIFHIFTSGFKFYVCYIGFLCNDFANISNILLNTILNSCIFKYEITICTNSK